MSTQHPEVLVVVGDAQEQKDLQKFLLDQGLKAHVVGDADAALALVEKRSFAAALLDSDTPTRGAGLELIATLLRLAPAMPVVLLTATRSFDVALAALRIGAADVVVKSGDQIEYLRKRLGQLTAPPSSVTGPSSISSTPGPGAQGRPDGRLLSESAALNEEFLRKLTEMARKVGELRDELISGASPLPEDEECRVLVVEEDGWLTKALGQLLPKGYLLKSVVSGGSALDTASGQRFHIALVKEGLPDLPGRMVVRTLSVQSPETITLLFTPPGERPGHVNVVEGSHTIPLLPQFTDPAQLADRLAELRGAQRMRGRERRYLSTFREENYDLLRRYADLRQRLGKT